MKSITIEELEKIDGATCCIVDIRPEEHLAPFYQSIERLSADTGGRPDRSLYFRRKGFHASGKTDSGIEEAWEDFF